MTKSFAKVLLFFELCKRLQLFLCFFRAKTRKKRHFWPKNDAFLE